MSAATLVTILNPLLAFSAGIYFSKWMGQRRHRSMVLSRVRYISGEIA